MDLDHLKKLVDASIEECERLNDTDTAYDDLLLYLEAELPRAIGFMRSMGTPMGTDLRRPRVRSRK